MSRNSSISLSHFETFLIVAELKNFTESAKKLNVTKAAISLSIKNLEDQMGVPLFNRTTRTVNLTHEGELLYKQCQSLKTELDITRDLITGFHDEPTGKLRISCNYATAEPFLMPVIESYMELYPKVEIDIIFEERMPDMRAEQIDLVFGVNWPATDDTIARKVGTTRYVLCAAPQYLEKYGTPTSLLDLSNHFYLPHTGRTQVPIVSTKAPLPVSLRLKYPLKVNDARFLKLCTLKGMGIAQFHQYVIQEELDNGSLIEILPETLKAEENLYIYYQKNRYVQPKVRQLVNMILETPLAFQTK